jgi:hypothetical protein
MLYASLLNRSPDPNGLTAYTVAIGQRGLRWATTEMMGSDEYNGRLNRICAGRSETATMYNWVAAQAFARDVLITRAYNLSAACGFNTALRSGLAALKNNPFPPAMAVGRIATVTNMIITGWGLDGTCGAAVTMLRAAYAINAKIDSERYNPVFIQYSVGSPGWTGQRSFTIRVGSDPTSWSPYSGRAW